MTAALYWLIGSCLVLNAVYSLPIDDGAVSFHPLLSSCDSSNESNNSTEKN